MSASAASLSCPICAHVGVFDSVQSLRDRLIYVSTNKMLCPVCQEEVVGLDKLTIHLFTHVKLLTNKTYLDKPKVDSINTPKLEKSVQQKKSKSTGVKNKTSPSTTNDPIKYVKIYPKLPVISFNPVSVIDISHTAVEKSLDITSPTSLKQNKADHTYMQGNTTCNLCGLQFVDTNILKMHRCLIHNIDESPNQNFTRHQCHICPKNFKMRGSLMVHLRVAHFGFLSGKCDSENIADNEETVRKKFDEDKSANVERNDNKQWQCDVCRKCFTTKYFLKKHKRLHTGETPYACTQCNKTFTFQQSYHKHLLYHNDEKPHTCSFCGRAFKELSTLHNHQRIHTGEKPFSCETCGKCFRQRVSYLVHRRIHTGVMPYKCTACEKSFRYKVSQRTHKCSSKPPGVVIRQTGDLVEKLKRKQTESNNNSNEVQNGRYPEISEASAELVRTGAKLSLEDMESDNFKLISEPFVNTETAYGVKPDVTETLDNKCNEVLNSNINELLDSIPIIDKNIPSPSEILKNLCLSKEEDFIGILQETNTSKNCDLYNDFNDFI